MHTHLEHIVSVGNLVKEYEHTVDDLDDVHGLSWGTNVSKPHHVVKHYGHIVKYLQYIREKTIWEIKENGEQRHGKKCFLFLSGTCHLI